MPNLSGIGHEPVSPRYQQGDEQQFALIRSPRQKRVDAEEERAAAAAAQLQQQHADDVDESDPDDDVRLQHAASSPAPTSQWPAPRHDHAVEGARQSQTVPLETHATGSLEEDVELLRNRVNAIQAHISHLKTTSRGSHVVDTAALTLARSSAASPSPRPFSYFSQIVELTFVVVKIVVVVVVVVVEFVVVVVVVVVVEFVVVVVAFLFLFLFFDVFYVSGIASAFV